MATIPYQVVDTPVDGPIKVIRWVGITENDQCTPFKVGHKADKTVQVTGTFGTGPAIAIQGSNRPEPASNEWDPLRDIFANVLDSLAARTIRQIAEGPLNLRPHVAAGTGVSVDVYLIIVGR